MAILFLNRSRRRTHRFIDFLSLLAIQPGSLEGAA
jgi:hypothetical protein